MNGNTPRHGILIGIAGGTGSGKTTAAANILDGLGSDMVGIVTQDAYYYDLSHLTRSELIHYNFDHPDAIEWDLLQEHIKILLEGGTVRQHIYDYASHTRTDECRTIGPHAIIVLEGILILDNPQVRELMDIKIYVDTADDVRLIRRVKRDVRDRGRTLDMVLQQYEETVRPMHEQFVEPSKRHADLIIPEGGKKMVAVDLVQTKIRQLLDVRGLI